jgi:hypothetical protein
MGSTHWSNEFMRIGSGKVIANFNTLTTTQKQDLLDFLRSLLGAPTPVDFSLSPALFATGPPSIHWIWRAECSPQQSTDEY